MGRLYCISKLDLYSTWPLIYLTNLTITLPTKAYLLLCSITQSDFLDKGAKAPASASIDAHGLFIKLMKYQVSSTEYKRQKEIKLQS
jgi:hypothetical protein